METSSKYNTDESLIVSCENKINLTQNQESPSRNRTDDLTDDLANRNFLLWPIHFVENKFSAGSIKGSIFTLISATIGAGILALPNAMAKSGVIFGSIQLLGCAALGYYSTFLLVRAGDISHEYSYQRLAVITYGKKFELFVKWIFFLNNWGGCVLYSVLINQLIEKALGILFESVLPDFMTNLNVTWFWPPIFTTFVIFPISLFRELKSLRYFCLLGFGFILYLTTVIVYETFNPKICDYKANFSQLELIKLNGITTTLPTVILAYMCHPNVLDVFRELQRSSKIRMSKVLRRSMGLVFCLYLIVGIAGYLTFANDLGNMGGANILKGNYQESIPITLAILFIGFSVTLATPLSIKPSKDSLRDIIYPYNLENINSDENKDSNSRHFCLVFITVYSQMAVSMIFTNIGTVIDFLGSSFYPMICFIFPCMFFLKIDQSPRFAPKRIICHCINALMILFAVYSTTTFCINCFFYGQC